MTRERFQELAEAYGADIARWPSDVRDAAALFAAAEPAIARRALAGEAGLDELLDALPRPRATAALYDRIVADAPAARRRRWFSWLGPAGLGAALAGAAAAGLLVGVQLSQQSSLGSEASAQAVADLDVSYVAELG